MQTLDRPTFEFFAKTQFPQFNKRQYKIALNVPLFGQQQGDCPDKKFFEPVQINRRIEKYTGGTFKTAEQKHWGTWNHTDLGVR